VKNNTNYGALYATIPSRLGLSNVAPNYDNLLKNLKIESPCNRLLAMNYQSTPFVHIKVYDKNQNVEFEAKHSFSKVNTGKKKNDPNDMVAYEVTKSEFESYLKDSNTNVDNAILAGLTKGWIYVYTKKGMVPFVTFRCQHEWSVFYEINSPNGQDRRHHISCNAQPQIYLFRSVNFELFITDANNDIKLVCLTVGL